MSLATPTATWFNDDHRLYAHSVSRFFADHLVPNIERWNEEEMVERNFWHKAGEAGILGATIPQTHGGAGGSITFDAISAYEQAHCGDNGWGFGIQSIVIGYVQAYATEEQKTRCGYQQTPKLIYGRVKQRDTCPLMMQRAGTCK